MVLYISDADLLTYDPLGACTGSFIHKLYGKNEFTGQRPRSKHPRYTKNYSFSESICQYQQFEVCFIKIRAILDFDSLYKFEMPFEL